MNSPEKKLLKPSDDQPSSVGDSPASLTVLQENVRRLVMTVISGQNSGELFAKLNPDGSWVKMSQDSVQVRMDGSLEEFCETWPKWGIMSDGVAGELLMLEHVTEGKGCSLLPTMLNTCDATMGELKGKEFTGNKHAMKLEQAINFLLPTPTTPRPHDNEKTAGIYLESQNQKDLTYAIAMIPTLTTNTGKNTSPGINFDKRAMKCHLDGVFMKQVGKKTGLQLQPAFAEWMMGFPEGWTALDASEMPSSRSKSTQSSKQSRKSKKERGSE